MPLLPDQMADFVNLTQSKFDRNTIVSIALDNQFYTFAELSGFDIGKITEDGGKDLRWKIRYRNNGSFEDSEMYHVNNPRRRDKTTEASINWTKQEVSCMWDVDEDVMQGGDMTRIVDFVQQETVSMYEDFFEGMEERLWSSPTSSTEIPRRFPGIPFWLQQASATAVTDFAFSGGNPSGFTAGPASVDTATYTKWKNGTAVYGTISDTDFVKKVVKACDKCYFQAPKKFNEAGGKPSSWAFYTVYSIIEELRDLLRGGNDNIKKDVTAFRNDVLIRGNDVMWVPELERSGSRAYTTAEPFYGVDKNNFKIVFQKGRNMQLLKPKEAPNQVTVREQYMLNWCTTKVVNRRRHFAMKRATT